MRIRVRLYGGLRYYTSSDPLEVDMQDGATVADAITSLDLRPGEVWLVRLQDELVELTHPLRPGDELSLIPPVGGGY